MPAVPEEVEFLLIPLTSFSTFFLTFKTHLLYNGLGFQ